MVVDTVIVFEWWIWLWRIWWWLQWNGGGYVRKSDDEEVVAVTDKERKIICMFFNRGKDNIEYIIEILEIFFVVWFLITLYFIVIGCNFP